MMAVLDGETALAQLEQQDFDLVIIDYQLPGMNGLETASCISERKPDTAAILISGKPLPDIREWVNILGLAGFSP